MKRAISFRMMLFVLLTSAAAGEARAQFLTWDDFLEQHFQAEETDDGTAWENFVEEMTALHEHPININAATKEDLMQFPFLTDGQIEEILFHIDYYGALHNVGELMLIPHLSYDTRQLLSFFVTFGEGVHHAPTPTLKDWLTDGRSQAIVRTDIPLYKRSGYRPFTLGEWQEHPSQHYWGNRLHTVARYSYQYGHHLFWGLAAEKDAGEPFFTRGVDGALLGSRGFDFYSGYVQLKDMNWLRNLTAGCYRLHFGQGLVMNTNFSLGKNMMLDNLERCVTADPISRHGGTNETDYLRGAAATVSLGDVEVTGFVSYRHYDATLTHDSVSTFLTTGLHRTSVEIDKQGNVSGMLAGGHLRYSQNGLHLGVTGLWQTFDHPLSRGTAAYKVYYPVGSRFANGSIDYAFYRRHISFTGETATGTGGGWATVNTLRVEPFERIYLTLLQRHYSRDYWGLQANAFSEGSEVRNERGIYVGADVQAVRQWRFTAYADLFRFPEPRYRVAEPSKGADVMASATYQPHDGFSLLTRYRCKAKERNVLSGYSFDGLFREVTQRLRLQANAALGPTWSMVTTADYCQVNAEAVNRGVRLAERLTCSGLFLPGQGNKLTLNGELAWFDVSDYAARLYGYERGLLYAYNYRAYYGNGLRAMLMADATLLGGTLTATLKIGSTLYFDRTSISTYAEQINQSHAEDLALQLRYKF